MVMAHATGAEPHNIVEREDHHWVVEKVAGADSVDRSEKGGKVPLLDGGLQKVGVEGAAEVENIAVEVLVDMVDEVVLQEGAVVAE